MTVRQFKEQYPQFAHLQGNILWDKMEDVLIKKRLPHLVYDWKGNQLKNGDWFCVIKVIQRQTMRFSGMMFLNGDGSIEFGGTHAEPRIPDYPCWEMGKYYEIRNGNYTIESSDGTTLMIGISILNFDLYQDDRFIIAIKGISDKQEEYEQREIS